MISTREAVTVRLEVDFEVLAGELRIMEEDIKKMPLDQFLQVWGPETDGHRIMLRLIKVEDKL